MPQWILYELPQPAAVCKVSFLPRFLNRGNPQFLEEDCPESFQFAGSNDGINFHPLLTEDNQQCRNDVRIEKIIDNQRAFKFYRLEVKDVPGRPGGNKFAIIRDLQFFGK